ncbi:hypothetical protein Q31b_14750 [Novipirellula aureliae]|uniref:Uncharacterized protein n=1 Tax=Novipirellula aureliae TaxID=2527966 RepID=A0A5C6E4T4_9BACT|nr:hypothetical protein Q31b_14750 [Novipirellula aureliae]
MFPLFAQMPNLIDFSGSFALEMARSGLGNKCLQVIHKASLSTEDNCAIYNPIQR